MGMETGTGMDMGPGMGPGWQRCSAPASLLGGQWLCQSLPREEQLHSYTLGLLSFPSAYRSDRDL